jgi:DNA polymerase
LARFAFVTVHPSALLRAPDEATRHRETERFIDDLRKIAELPT